MSLLDVANTTVRLYPEEAVEDKDGNIRTRASDTPIEMDVWIAPLAQSGTSARRAEQDNEGYETEQVYRMRVLRKDMGMEIGAQAKVEWRGEMWSIFGEELRFNGSPRTAHHDYTLRRS